MDVIHVILPNCHTAIQPYCHKVSLDPPMVSPPTPTSQLHRMTGVGICSISTHDAALNILNIYCGRGKPTQCGAGHATGRKIISPGAEVVSNRKRNSGIIVQGILVEALKLSRILALELGIKLASTR